MKKFLKIAALMMALALVLGAFAACGGTADPADDNGGGKDEGGTTDSVKGTTQEHGYYKVFVPEGYTLVHEDVFGDNDPESFNINQDGGSFTYFMFNMNDEDGVKMSIDTTKEMNDGAADVSVEYNGVTWTGVAYDSLGIACFSMYAPFGDNYVIVMGAGNAYDSDVTGAVLGSLVVNVTE